MSKDASDKKINLSSISLSQAFWVWVKVAIYSFGGPAGQIAVMHRILVEEKRWVNENRFLHALNYCMLLPGPEAQQLATYIGWLLHGTIGGLIAGILFIIPGFLSILLLSLLYVTYYDVSWIQAVFLGLKSAVVVIVVHAVIRIGKKSLKNGVMLTLAAFAFIAIFFFAIPFPVIVFTAAIVGYVGGHLYPDKFHVIKGHQVKEDEHSEYCMAERMTPTFTRAVKVIAIWSCLWFVPLFVMVAIWGIGNIYVQEGIFFSKAAVVTFGGAYSVLSYIAQQAVNTYGWLKPGEMLDGLGMAETTPGPLIQVVQFVGFMGAYRNPGTLDPLLAGVLGSIFTTWVTFIPCFLWIFLGAPYIENLRENKSLNTALSAITAAVVGVVLNLALWFSLHTMFRSVEEIQLLGGKVLIPVWSTLNLPSLLISGIAFIAMFRFKTGMITTLAGCVILGIVCQWL